MIRRIRKADKTIDVNRSTPHPSLIDDKGRPLRPNHALLAAIVITFSALTAVGQGIYMESKGSSGDNVERFWYMPHMFRSTEENGNISVIRLDKEVIYHIDPEKKTYTELYFSEMKGMQEKVAAMAKKRMENMTPAQKQKMEELKKNMQSMSPEQRKALEGRMGGKMEPSKNNTYEIAPTGETNSISGFTCTKYIVKRNGEETETVWATNDIPETESLRKDMEQFMEKVSTNFGKSNAGHEWHKEIRGFPIQTISHGSTRTVTKIEQRSIYSSEFDIPAGYTKTKMKGLEDLDQEGKN